MKSCSAKESKVVSTKDAKYVLNASKEDSQERLTDEQILINKKLIESGIDDEGLGWIEKTNIFKTINVSLDTAGSERLQRSSPRLAKATNSTAGKWIENSFENTKHDCDKEKIHKNKSSKDSDTSSVQNLTPSHRNNNSSQEPEEPVLKSNQKLESTNSQNVDTPKSSKKVHYIKVNIEENSKVECKSLVEGVVQGLSLGKKRASQPEKYTLETPKKIKMDEISNGVSSQEEKFLQIDEEMEKMKSSEPFKVRDVKLIVSECEIRNRKWKETFSKYKCPTRWGLPIVRSCSEKWDGKQIPPKLLHRFQRYLSEKDLTHPVFFPVKLQSSVDLDSSNSEGTPQSGASNITEFKVEPESIGDSGEKFFTLVNSDKTGSENNLNASTSGEEISDRMVLRNRSQQKTVISDEEEEFSSDDSEDWLVKQKSTKKQKFNAKNKKISDQSNKQLVLKLERCNINKGNGKEGGRKNSNKNGVSFTPGSITSANALNQSCTKSAPDPDTVICPICSLRFKKQFIESHATECASKTYKD